MVRIGGSTEEGKHIKGIFKFHFHHHYLQYFIWCDLQFVNNEILLSVNSPFHLFILSVKYDWDKEILTGIKEFIEFVFFTQHGIETIGTSNE